MKSLAKTFIQRCAEVVGPHRWPDGTPRLWVLMYHRIIPEQLARQEGEEPGMFVTPETFGQHLQWIRQHLTVVRLAEWVKAAREGDPLPAKACAITFDDGWQDNYRYAFPLLAAAGLPATVFAVSGYVGTHRAFWPNRIARLLRVAPGLVSQSVELQWLRDAADSVGLDISTVAADTEALSRLIAVCKSHPDAWLQHGLDAADALVPGLVSNRAMLDWSELAEMQRSGVFDVGSHTRNHQRLVGGLEPALLEDEIVGSRLELEQHLGSAPTLFCYPNGDLSPAAEALVACTYQAAVTTRRGINRVSTPRASLCRVGMHEDASRTRGQFLARLAGWL